MGEEEEIGWDIESLSNSKLKTDTEVFGQSDDAPFGISFKNIIRGCSVKNHRPWKEGWGKDEEGKCIEAPALGFYLLVGIEDMWFP